MYESVISSPRISIQSTRSQLRTSLNIRWQRSPFHVHVLKSLRLSESHLRPCTKYLLNKRCSFLTSYSFYQSSVTQTHKSQAYTTLVCNPSHQHAQLPLRPSLCGSHRTTAASEYQVALLLPHLRPAFYKSGCCGKSLLGMPHF